MAFLYKSAAFILLLTVASLAHVALAEDGPRILDLSQDFPVGNVNNPNASLIESLLTRDVRRMLVLDDGDIVMDYQRNTVADNEVYNLWSATKAVISVIMGTILTSDEYDLSMGDTLGEIFTEEKYWSEILDQEEVEFKMNVTIYELLTMTSGLISTLDTGLFSFNPLKPFDVANSAGINLKESLAEPGWNATLKGNFNYMPTSNILSYVIENVTGMSPLEYASVDLLPSLGISPDEIEWDKNFGGVETSYSSLKMTAKQMAKFAQLFLQKGKSAPDKQLLPEEWVDESISSHVFADLFGVEYGYLWLGINATNFPGIPPGMPEGLVWCGSGFAGQMFCMHEGTKRVAVGQRSNTLYDAENEGNLAGLIFFAFHPNNTYTGETPTSGAVFLSVWGTMAAVATMSWLSFWV